METHSFEILALSCFLSFVFLPFSFVCISGLLFLSFSADWHNDSPCIQREQPWADAATHILLFLNLVPLVSGLSCSLVCCFTLGMRPVGGGANGVWRGLIGHSLGLGRKGVWIPVG